MPQKPLIEKLDITHFRGVNELSLDNLSCVNVLAGANNCGKTSVLEALTLLGAPDSFRTVTEMALYRISPSIEQEEDNRINYVLSMFYNTGGRSYVVDLGAEVNGESYRYQILGELDKKSSSFRRIGEVLHLHALEPGISETTLWKANVENGEEYDFDDEDDYEDDEDDEEYGMGYYKHSTIYDTFDPFYLPATQVNYYRMGVRLMLSMAREEKTEDILRVMQIFDPNITAFNVYGRDLYVKHKYSRAIPLYAYGYGMQKAVALASVTLNMEDGVLLIDEIENSIHMSAFEEVFRWFIETCLRSRVQVFLTTHSAEALDAILQVVHDHFQEQDVLRVITLRKDMEANLTRKIVRTGEEAYQDRELYKEELRI